MAEYDSQLTWLKQSDSSKPNLRNSYNLQTLSRVQTVLRAVKQTEALGRRLQNEIETSLSQARHTQSKNSELEKLLLLRKKVQDECEWRRQKLHTEKEQFDAIQTGNLHKDRTLKQKFDILKKDRSRLHEKKKVYFSVREELIKSGAQLVMRRKQLISELAFIYPIREVSSNTFTVAGIELPNAEHFQGSSEVGVEVAMGYTCHLVLMVSHFLDMPLRYVMKHCGSKSIVYDYILDKLSSKDREFVLSSRGNEKFQFDYGVYLLNKNIAQLRYYCGLGTTDLRLTLPNLKTLLQLRLGVNFDHLESSKSELLTKRVGSDGRQKDGSRHSACSAPVCGPECKERGEAGGGRGCRSVQDPVEQCSQPAEDVFTPASDRFFGPPARGEEREASVETEAPSRQHTKPNSSHQHSSTPTSKHQPSSLLDQLTKEKLLGPIANDQEIEVSSSEDSASAVYRYKLCPRLEEPLSVVVPTLHNSRGPSVKSEDRSVDSSTGQPASDTEHCSQVSSSDSEFSDVEDVPTFSQKACRVPGEQPTDRQVNGELIHTQISETEGQVGGSWSEDTHTDIQDTPPTFHITHQ